MNIRIAQQTDLEAIVDIYNQAIAAGEKTADLEPCSVEDKREWFSNHGAEKYPIWVAEDDNTILGYLTLSPHRAGRTALRYTAEVSYYIHFEHHRRCVASQLLIHAINNCPALQIKTLFAILLDTNAASIKLLEKFGFEKWGHLPRVAEMNGQELGQFYYGRRVDQAL